MALVCISLMINEVENLLGAHFAIFISSLVKCLLMCVIGRTTAPQRYATVPRTSRICYFTQRGYFVDVIKGMDLEISKQGLPWWCSG